MRGNYVWDRAQSQHADDGALPGLARTPTTTPCGALRARRRRRPDAPSPASSAPVLLLHRALRELLARRPQPGRGGRHEEDLLAVGHRVPALAHRLGVVPGERLVQVHVLVADRLDVL